MGIPSQGKLKMDARRKIRPPSDERKCIIRTSQVAKVLKESSHEVDG